MYNYFQIVERLKTIKNLKDDEDLAEMLGLSQSALSNRKSRDSDRLKEIISFCEKEGISVDWLFRDKPYDLGFNPPDPREVELLKRWRESDERGRKQALDALEAGKKPNSSELKKELRSHGRVLHLRVIEGGKKEIQS